MKEVFKEKKNRAILVLFVCTNALLGSFAALAGISGADAKETGFVSALLLMLLFFLVGGILGGLLFMTAAKLPQKEYASDDENTKGIAMFFVALSVLLSVWMFYFLAYYPGIVSYDSYIQVGQIIKGEYNEHHPLIHTLTIKAMYELGCSVFNSPNAGMALYVILQGILLALSFSYVLSIVGKRLGKTFYIAGLIILTIYPYNGFLAISVTKDIPFSAFMLVSLAVMYRIMTDENEKKGEKIPKYILLFAALFGSVLFRNNGKYAILFMLGIMVICVLLNLLLLAAKKKKFNGLLFNLTAVTTVALIAGVIVLTMVKGMLSADQGDRREMLSVPIQQLARTYAYHAGAGVKDTDDNTMDEESKALISEFILNDAAKLYRADISDPVKRNVNTWVVVNKTESFAKTYIKLAFKYPFDYVKAFFGTNAGYFNPFDKTHMHINEMTNEDGDIIPGGAYIQTGWSEENLPAAGIVKDSVMPGLRVFLEKIANSNILNRIPVVGLLFVPASFLFVYVNVLLTLVLQKKYKLLIPLCMTAGYYITLFLGPTVQLRYIYPVMISVPLMAVFCLAGKKEKKVE